MADGVKIKIDGDDSGFKDKISKIGDIAKKSLSGIGDVAKKGMSIVTGSIAAVSGALTAAGGAAAKFGMEFEQSAAKASTLFGDVAVDTDGLNKKILALSSATGVAATELNEGLYSALSAGIPATEDMGDATAFLESSAKLAKAGFTDVDTAISATAKTLNAYGMDVSEADKIQGILIQTQNKGITTVGELGASLAQVTPTAAAFGVSFENVGASLATMTAQGTPTAQATTQLNSLIAELGKSGTLASKNLTEAAEGTKFAGQSFTEMMNGGASLDEVLGLLQGTADKNGKSMVDMFSSIEAGKAALAITSEGGATFNENLQAMADTAGVVDAAYGTMAGTLQAQSERMTESVKNLGISIYEENDSMLASAAGFAAGLVEQLQGAFNEGGLDGLIAEFGDVASQLVIKISEAAPQMIDAALTLITSFVSGITDNISTIQEGATTIMNSIYNGITELMPQLPTIIGSIATSLAEGFIKYASLLVQVGIQLITSIATGLAGNADDLISTALEMIDDIVAVFTENLPLFLDAAVQIILALVNGLTTAIPDLIPVMISCVLQIVDTLINNLDMLIDAAIQLILALANGLITALPQLVEKIPVIIVKLQEALINNAGVLAQAAIQLILALAGGIIQSIPSLLAALPTLIQALFNALTMGFQIINSVGDGIIRGLWQGIKDAKNWLQTKLKEWCKSIVDAIKGWFGIHSPSTVMRDQVGKMLVKGIAVGIDDNKSELQKVIDSMNEDMLESEKYYLSESKRIEEEKAAAEYAQKVANAKDNEELQKIINDKANEEAEKSQKNYLDSLKSAADKEKKIIAAIAKDIEKEKKTIVDFYQDIFESASDAIDNLEKKQDDLKKNLQKFVGDIYNTSKKTLTQKDAVAFGYLLPKDSKIEYEVYGLADLKTKNEQLKAYAENLQKLKDRGAPTELFDEIRDMDIDEAQTSMYALLHASDDEFNTYVDYYNENQKLISDISKKAYEDDAEELQKTLLDKFGETPEKFFDIGQESAEKYGAGFMEQLRSVLAAAQKAIRETMAGIAPTAVIASGISNAVPATSYVDNRQTIINANGVTAHEIIEAKNQDDIYKSHTQGWND